MPVTRRSAYEARVWRLAFLLTGGAEPALAVVEGVLRTRPDLSRVAPEHLDRLVVLHAREWANAGSRRRTRRGSVALELPQPSTSASRALRAAAAMPRQSLEAWVLTRLDGLDEITVSRAMDCSKAAAIRNLQQADDALAAVLGGSVAGDIEALRAFADGMDPAPFLVLGRRRCRRRRMVRLGAWAVVVVAAVVGGIIGVRATWPF